MKKPEFFSMIQNRKKLLTKEQVINDVIAGSVVAIIALPLSIAIGISSGVSPEKGLLTAILASLCVSIFGGSRVQIGGPTGGFVVIVYGVIQKYGFTGLIISTLMAGFILIILGLFHLGNLIRFIPKSIILGFTAGIGVVLFSAQIQEFFGLRTGKLPVSFFGKWNLYILSFKTVSITTLILGLISILIIITFPKVNRIIPSYLIALIVVTLIVKFMNINVDTIGSSFGHISSSIPMPELPAFGTINIKNLILPSITIAFLGYIQALLTAVVSDDMIGEKHSSNTELISQGIANIVSSLFGGIPATGAIARTTASIKNGGRTPLAGLVHAGILLFILLICVPLLQYVPLTVLAAILIVVSYNMGNFSDCIKLIKEDKASGFELILTLILTVCVNLVIAIAIAMIVHLIRVKIINNKIHTNRIKIRNKKIGIA
ncbi:SulP family inorganic anion transporter [uncultured Clostridium sp.]|uniref:SulP family inorganic anion transporter n=1 Tax=uncultured Clostridium sp. TaxID=59620 RepID=UPI002585B1E8|nr:SulP family inorganic anion transporter [uncultured Clostridium sp.]